MTRRGSGVEMLRTEMVAVPLGACLSVIVRNADGCAPAYHSELEASNKQDDILRSADSSEILAAMSRTIYQLRDTIAKEIVFARKRAHRL